VPGTNELCYRVAVEQIGQLAAGKSPTNVVVARRA
jgi:hypothetical protein